MENRWIFGENAGNYKANDGICNGDLMIFIENCGFFDYGAILMKNISEWRDLHEKYVRMVRFSGKIY